MYGLSAKQSNIYSANNFEFGCCSWSDNLGKQYLELKFHSRWLEKSKSTESFYTLLVCLFLLNFSDQIYCQSLLGSPC